jgi:hypothetical protein
MSNPDYVLTASLVLDAHHEAGDDGDGCCPACLFASGYRDDGWGHFTWASVDEAWDWTEANRA